MATITATKTPIKTFGDQAVLFYWAAMTTTNNYGDMVSLPGWGDRCVQLTGTLSTGGAVTMYGSNIAAPNEANDNDWFAMNDAQGNSLALNSLRGEQIIECPLWVRPKITGGDGSTSLNVSLLLVRRGR